MNIIIRSDIDLNHLQQITPHHYSSHNADLQAQNGGKLFLLFVNEFLYCNLEFVLNQSRSLNIHN